MVLATLIKFLHKVLSKTMLLSNLLVLRSFSIVSLIFFRFLSTSSCLILIHLIFSPYNRIYKSSLYMPKSSKSIFHHLFCDRCYFIGTTGTNNHSNITIFNPISPSLITHPIHHIHLYNIVRVLILNHLTFYLVQHHKSHHNLIKKFLWLEPYFCVT